MITKCPKCPKCGKVKASSLHHCDPRHRRRSYRSFIVSVEAEICPNDRPFNESSRSWRAIVRIGQHMEWQWFERKSEAVAWIKSWEKPSLTGKTLVQVLAENDPITLTVE